MVEGRYMIDYSRSPIEIDISVKDKETLQGIIRFVGEDRNRMQMLFDPEGKKRPVAFEPDLRLVTWTKKAKK